MIAEGLDKIIAGIFLLTIAFTVLAYGTVEPWAIAIFELLILLQMLLWAFKSVFSKRFELKIPLTAFPVAAFLLFGILQSIALKGSGGEILSLSYNVEATRSAVEILFFLLISHLIAFNFFATQQRMRILANFLILFGSVLGAYSFIRYFIASGGVFYGGISAPFVNHNHLAGYLELIIPLPVVLISVYSLKHLRILYAFATVMIAVAIIGSLSRGGVISVGAGLVFILITRFIIQHRNKSAGKIRNVPHQSLPPSDNRLLVSRFGPMVLLLAVIILGVVWIGIEPITDRVTDNTLFREDEKAQTFDYIRGWIWKDAVTIFQKNPIFGTGMGTFETVYPNYSAGHGIPETVNQAHNDYLQILTDTGLIGGAIALWFVVAIAIGYRRSLFLRDPVRSAVAIGCAAAICSMMVHSVFDFNLQLPATSLLFLVLTATLINAASNADDHRVEE